jgi:hypothetical protein
MYGSTHAETRATGRNMQIEYSSSGDVGLLVPTEKHFLCFFFFGRGAGIEIKIWFYFDSDTKGDAVRAISGC